MRITARKDEVQRIVDLLESDEFGSAEDMAAALFLEVSDLLWFRDWHVLIVNDNGRVFGYGPFSREDEAARTGMKYQGVLVPGDSTKWGVVKVRGLGGTAEEREGGGFGFCANEGCGHPAYAHSMDGSSRGYCVVCGRNGACPKYEQAKAKPRARKRKEAA